MKKRRKKIRWGNVIKAIALLICIGVIVKDIYMLTLYSFITGNYVGFSWLGLVTSVSCFLIGLCIIEDFAEQMEKMSSTRTTQHLKHRK